ncbi:SigB/SigF/SigG family RNA polymerase sigma factor [Kitasatospora aureofaciens]|uniref:SigB/SigF/SigG family RNA polymerase sigma factor n=1 Tax=Kitasatospora aureofaciens TaxID=1894 RepID=UPI0034083827
MTTRTEAPAPAARPADTTNAIRRHVAPELAGVDSPRDVAPSDARELTRMLLRRLTALEEGTREYSYVRSTLIELNLSLVRYVIRRFDAQREPQEDLLQVGAVGLIKAIDRFDPDRDVEFSTFAIPTVLGEIRRHFRDTTWAVHVPRRLQELRIALAKAQDDLTTRLDRAPTVAELAGHLRLSEEEVIEGLTAANARTTGSLDFGSADDDESGSPLADRLGQEDAAIDLTENLVALKPLIARLSTREQLILSLRFTDELTQSQIGARLGLSQMHVSRLLTRTLKKLRDGLNAA